jgi:hypothetical protein
MSLQNHFNFTLATVCDKLKTINPDEAGCTVYKTVEPTKKSMCEINSISMKEIFLLTA